MATIPPPSRLSGSEADIDYPTGDGKPVAETPIHYRNLKAAVETLDRHFQAEPMVYVWGNMLVFYEEGNRRKHVSPDTFVALGVPKDKPRDNYLIWQEGHGLDLVIELTSKSTKEEDLDHKMAIYRDIIGVSEYFLFDPRAEYLAPPLQGYRLREGQYERIQMVDGRLPSEVTGLHLERDGQWLRFYNPLTGRRLLTTEELLLGERAERERAEAEREYAEARCERAEAERERAESERKLVADQLEGSAHEVERLRLELESWRRRFGSQSGETPL
ncbi:MAG TPA: Uma2 family endonuclease [Pirellulales bacterium]